MRRYLSILILATVVTACSSEENLEDPYLWLEPVDDPDVIAWVEKHNAQAVSYAESLPNYKALYARNRAIYDSDDRIAYPTLLGDSVYNFWRDDENPRGLWRRTDLETYVSGQPRWETVVDLDALAAAESENWVWKGATCNRPTYRRCLLRLSRGGADAVVVREFDTASRAFVDGGFFVPESKVRLSWLDQDTVFVGTDFGDGDLTTSGYPRTSRLWRRGEPLSEAVEVWAGESGDVSAMVYRGWDGDRHYDIARRTPTTFTAKRYLFSPDGNHVFIDIPDDADFLGLMHGQMLVELKRDWQIDATTYRQGSLLSIDFDAFMNGSRNFTTVIAPTDRKAIPRGGVMATRDYLIVRQLEDVVSTLTRFEFHDGQWQGTEIPTEPFGTINLLSASDTSNVFFFSYAGFTRPTTLYIASNGGGTVEPLMSLPAFFDASGVDVQQHFAVSRDGTRVPYFFVVPAGFEANGDTPTLISAYGGFQISRTPYYGATTGHSWIERGGALVVANIRGGGEYGPAWHHAALRENRQRAYDDLIAVAEDLVERDITKAERLGVWGGSNGGLLTGVMLTQRPDLWGAVIIQVPLLDMKRYHKLLAGASWMEEYGDPDTSDWDYIKAYSPYQNLDAEADYPTPFVTTSTRDDRVHPAHARKFVARLREYGHDVHYFENTVGGHAGASNFEQVARIQAMLYSYLWDQLGSESQ